MEKIKIQWIEHQHHCETCGSAYAYGAIVDVAGLFNINMEPVAHCYNGVSYNSEEVFERILFELGYVVEEVTDE